MQGIGCLAKGRGPSLFIERISILSRGDILPASGIAPVRAK
jgi:hypothetical protein